MTGVHRLHRFTDDGLSVLAVGRVPSAWHRLADIGTPPPAFGARRALAPTR